MGKYLTTYQVEGAGDFPYDMLRYDAAFPWRETDAALLYPSHREKRVVTVGKFHTDKTPQISKPRWRSFGWRVIDSSVTTEKCS